MREPRVVSALSYRVHRDQTCVDSSDPIPNFEHRLDKRPVYNGDSELEPHLV